MQRLCILYKQKKCNFYEVYFLNTISDIDYFFDFIAPYCIDYELYSKRGGLYA